MDRWASARRCALLASRIDPTAVAMAERSPVCARAQATSSAVWSSEVHRPILDMFIHSLHLAAIVFIACGWYNFCKLFLDMVKGNKVGFSETVNLDIYQLDNYKEVPNHFKFIKLIT